MTHKLDCLSQNDPQTRSPFPEWPTNQTTFTRMPHQLDHSSQNTPQTRLPFRKLRDLLKWSFRDPKLQKMFSLTTDLLSNLHHLTCRIKILTCTVLFSVVDNILSHEALIPEVSGSSYTNLDNGYGGIVALVTYTQLYFHCDKHVGLLNGCSGCFPIFEAK